MVREKVQSFKDTVVHNPSFTLKEQLGYAGGIFGNCMGQDSIGTFADKFFRGFMGINNDQMLLMGNVLTFFGFIPPPIAGNLLDAPTKPGKRSATKTFLKYMPIPFAISSMLLFIVPSSDSLVNFIWALILHLIFNTVDSFYDISLNTLSLRMTNNQKDRKNFYTVSTLASSLGSMLPGWVIPMIVGSMDTETKKKWAYFFIALVFCFIGIAMMYAPYFTLEEKIKVVAKPKKTVVQWDKQTLLAVLHNRTFVVTEVATFFESIRQVSYSLLTFMYEDVFDDYKMKAAIDAISGGLSYAGLAAVPLVGKKLSARTVLCGGFSYTGIFYTIIALLGMNFNLTKVRKRRYLVGILIGLSGMPNNALSAAKKIVVGDSTDYMEWYSEKNMGTPIHSEGLLTATQGICSKLFDFVKINLKNLAFKSIGFKENTIDKATGETIKAVQSDKTLKGLYMVFAFCGIVGNFLAALSYLLDNYTGKKKDEIYAELQEMRKARALAGEVKADAE